MSEADGGVDELDLVRERGGSTCERWTVGVLLIKALTILGPCPRWEVTRGKRRSEAALGAGSELVAEEVGRAKPIGVKQSSAVRTGVGVENGREKPKRCTR